MREEICEGSRLAIEVLHARVGVGDKQKIGFRIVGVRPLGSARIVVAVARIGSARIASPSPRM